jgi:hypothetical protein
MVMLRLFLFFASFTFAVLVKKIFRPWAYQKEIRFLGIADWGPSLFYIIGMVILIATLITKTGRLRHLKVQIMWGVIAGALFYEISQSMRSDRWFNWEDFFATMVGGLIAVFFEGFISNAENKI